MLKLISINIERSKHLDRVLAFVRREDPDVLCMQEVLERDIPFFLEAFDDGAFAHSGFHPADPPEGGGVHTGIAIFSRLPMQEKRMHYYTGSEEEARLEDPKELLGNSSVLSCVIEQDDTPFTIATTHFTWSPRGEATDEQRRDVQNLLHYLRSFDELVLCGDLNAPRGGDIFARLAEVYTDNIPPSYQTSLDIDLHRSGIDHRDELADKMVDGLFTTPSFRAENVRLEFGVSDHAGIVAELDRV